MNRKKYINLFCQIFHKNELEELRPYWCQCIKSEISIHSMELLATSIIFTLEKMGVKPSMNILTSLKKLHFLIVDIRELNFMMKMVASF